MSSDSIPSSNSTPYIGSKITLIAKSEVRYEGVLYNINTIKSTVALQNGNKNKSINHQNK